MQFNFEQSVKLAITLEKSNENYSELRRHGHVAGLKNTRTRNLLENIYFQYQERDGTDNIKAIRCEGRRSVKPSAYRVKQRAAVLQVSKLRARFAVVLPQRR
jgi:hypothetical protein